MQDLLKVFRDQKTYFGALFLQHDVGRYRGAVKERGDVGGGDPSFLDQLLNAVENADRLIARSRRRLQETHRARALVEQQQISKCPADIDAEAATHITPCVGRFEIAFSPKPGPIPHPSPLPKGSTPVSAYFEAHSARHFCKL